MLIVDFYETTKHLTAIGYKVSLVYARFKLRLVSQMVLDIKIVSFAKKLQESKSDLNSFDADLDVGNHILGLCLRSSHHLLISLVHGREALTRHLDISF